VQPAIEVRALAQQARSGAVTLTDVSLAIGSGKLVAIIGASGSGKTTLLDTVRQGRGAPTSARPRSMRCTYCSTRPAISRPPDRSQARKKKASSERMRLTLPRPRCPRGGRPGRAAAPAVPAVAAAHQAERRHPHPRQAQAGDPSWRPGHGAADVSRAVPARPVRPGGPEPGGHGQVLFRVAFGGFFFGLTYGLLQICGEYGVLRRERFAGLGAAAYVLAKVAVLLPLLALVDLLFLVVLRTLGRPPAAGDYGRRS
jgi:ABC transporter family protein